MFTTYESGCVVIISAKENKLVQLTRGFKKPMGIAIHKDKLALATLNELLVFSNNNDLALTYPNKPETYDYLYMPRASYYTGNLDLHDIDFGSDNEIYAVNTRFSCISKIDADFSFKPVWKPSFISRILPEDRCHLNGMALLDGKPKYVTALSQTDVAGGWRDNITSSGVLIDIVKNKVILEGLGMPHSPRIINNQLYLLQSAKGEVIKVNTIKKTYEVVARIPGILRGMTEYGNYVFIGVSKPRKTSKTFEKLPEEFKKQSAGIVVFYKPTWGYVGEIKYSSPINEIFDVQVLPNLLRPNIMNRKIKFVQDSIVAKNLSFWYKKHNIAKDNHLKIKDNGKNK
jgi:uncharacterized protein (TIGR03032 family)